MADKAAMDLAEMSIEELDALQEQITQALHERRKEERREKRRQMKELAKELGYEVSRKEESGAGVSKSGKKLGRPPKKASGANSS